MEKRIKKLHISGIIAALFFLTLSVFMSSVSVSAATNKAARLYVTFDGKEEVKDGDWDKHVYSIGLFLPKTSKVKSGMTVSYKIYIPKSLFKKDGDYVDICMDLTLAGKDKNGYYGVGSIYKTRWVSIEKRGKKFEGRICNDVTGKMEKFSKYASLKSSGNYYVLTMKDVLGKNYYDYKARKNKKINTKTAYTLIPELVIHGNGKFSGYIYLDEFTVKAAKTQKVTFSGAKEYTNLGASYWGSKDWTKKLKIVKL